MRVALLNVQLLDGNNVVAPLGVLYIAGQLERDGHTVAVFDGDPDAFPLLSRIVSWRPDVVGISFLTAASSRAFAVLEKLRRALPHCFIMAGGVHPTIFPEPTLRRGADVVVTGEGEETASEVLARVAAGQRQMAGVPGTVYLDGNHLVDNGARALMADLRDLPRPARHLIDFTPYLAPPGVIRGYCMSRIVTVFATRGCPYGCIYCGSHNIFGRKIRYRPVDDLVSEMAELHAEYGARGIYFCDDLFTLDRDWVRDFCEELQRRLPGRLRWACQTRVDAVHIDLLQTMRAAGCVQIDFGVESGSERILQILSRKTPKPKILAAFRAAKAAGLRTCATFILGSPEEKEEDVAASFELATQLRADFTAFYYATPYPGTRLYDLALEEGWIEPTEVFDENWVHRQPNRPVLAIHFTPEQLVELRRKLANPFFARNFLRWRNLPFFASLAGIAVRYPKALPRALRRALASGRLEDGVESLFAQYQYDKYRTGYARTEELQRRPARPKSAPPSRTSQPHGVRTPPAYPSGHRRPSLTVLPS